MSDVESTHPAAVVAARRRPGRSRRLSRALRGPGRRPHQAAARRPLRAHDFRRQPDDAETRRGLGAAPFAHEAGRVRVYRRRRADACHRRWARADEAGHVRRVQGRGRGASPRQRDGSDVVYLEVGDRTPGDTAVYPDDDLTLADVAGGGVTRTRTERLTQRRRRLFRQARDIGSRSLASSRPSCMSGILGAVPSGTWRRCRR